MPQDYEFEVQIRQIYKVSIDANSLTEAVEKLDDPLSYGEKNFRKTILDKFGELKSEDIEFWEV